MGTRRLVAVLALSTALAGCGSAPGLGLVPSDLPELRAPLRARLSSGFGWRADPFGEGHRFHEGLDYAAPAGTPAAASRAGVVARAGPAGTYGNLVALDHGGGLETRYAHLSAIAVRVGQRVTAGQAIGRVGSTGRSTGPHLHFEVRVNGRAVDPLPAISP